MAIEAVNVKFSYMRKEVYSDLNLNIETSQAIASWQKWSWKNNFT